MTELEEKYTVKQQIRAVGLLQRGLDTEKDRLAQAKAEVLFTTLEAIIATARLHKILINGIFVSSSAGGGSYTITVNRNDAASGQPHQGFYLQTDPDEIIAKLQREWMITKKSKGEIKREESEPQVTTGPQMTEGPPQIMEDPPQMMEDPPNDALCPPEDALWLCHPDHKHLLQKQRCKNAAVWSTAIRDQPAKNHTIAGVWGGITIRNAFYELKIQSAADLRCKTALCTYDSSNDSWTWLPLSKAQAMTIYMTAQRLIGIHEHNEGYAFVEAFRRSSFSWTINAPLTNNPDK